MSLTLITGPANAAKAGAVLERLRAARPRGSVARERVVRAAIAEVPLRALARSAATPGFAAAAGALFAELQRSLVTPARFTSALRAWAGAAPAGAAGADSPSSLGGPGA